MVGECNNVMVQALQTQDSSLPQVLTVQNTYTKLRKDSKKTFVVIRNNTSYSQTLQKKTLVARAVAASPLLAEYHDMFSLDPMELGCTCSMEHTIKVTDDTAFKEWFR